MTPLWRVKCTEFLKVHILDDLSWSNNINSLNEAAQQRLHFVRIFRVQTERRSFPEDENVGAELPQLTGIPRTDGGERFELAPWAETLSNGRERLELAQSRGPLANGGEGLSSRPGRGLPDQSLRVTGARAVGGIPELMERAERDNRAQKKKTSANATEPSSVQRKQLQNQDLQNPKIARSPGSHPNVTEGEVTRTVCFTWNEDTCHWSREIQLKNCSDYFVYHLKPTPCSRVVYCTAAGTARFDPCVTHTVQDQLWRSTDCSHTECTGGQWMGDGKLEVRWYRFNSSGGRMISETVFPEARCSGVIPGWLNGSHPSVEEGEVTRTVCFTWRDFTCYWRREIKVKNCCRYFVYQLKPAPCSSAVYCTAPETATTEQAKLTSTEGSTQEPSTAPSEEPSLAPETATTEQAKLTSTEASTQEPSTAPREEPSLEEEHTWIEVLVAASGGMTDEEVREATRHKLREMFGDPDPQLELVLCMSEIPEE
ncbi:uncharacterized protein [Hemitrygon akajei]|uniref:uncharacterized protein n=1 Tax=Hemitrygon akajei TaxID=2704970 RepID=UPI003BF9DE1C